MIYTSYFAGMKSMDQFRDHVIPVAICRGVPEWYTGARYAKLAPSWELVKEWKADPRNDDYFGIKRKQYDAEVLSKLDPKQVVKDFQRLFPGGEPLWESKRYHVVLMCYERPTDFCHRHFVAQWLTENGYPCEELFR